MFYFTMDNHINFLTKCFTVLTWLHYAVCTLLDSDLYQIQNKMKFSLHVHLLVCLFLYNFQVWEFALWFFLWSACFLRAKVQFALFKVWIHLITLFVKSNKYKLLSSLFLMCHASLCCPLQRAREWWSAIRFVLGIKRGKAWW